MGNVGKKYDNRVQIQYKYEDQDGIVTSAYILCGNNKIELTVKMGTETIKDLDLEHNEYEVVFVITYLVDGAIKEIRSEKIIVGTKYVAPTVSNITYILNGGTNNESNPSTYEEGTTTLLFDATRTGYKFLGWYLNNERVTEISPAVTGDITLDAKFEYIKKTYHVTYNLNGGTNATSNPDTVTEGESYKLSDAVRAGYKFLGWYLNGERVTEINSITSDITLDAKFEIIETPKKGCGKKKSMLSVITLISLVSVATFIIRKKH